MSRTGFFFLIAIGIGYAYALFYARRAKRQIEQREKKQREDESK